MYSTIQNVQGPIGKIDATVEKAILTHDACTFGTMDPYFYMFLSSVKSHKSKERRNEGKYPLWNETFIYELDDEKLITINVYHEKTLVKSYIIK